MEPHRHATVCFRAGLSRSLYPQPFSSRVLRLLREVCSRLRRGGDEDGRRGTTIEVGFVIDSLARNPGHLVDIIVDDAEARRFDLARQVIDFAILEVSRSGVYEDVVSNSGTHHRRGRRVT